MRELMDGAIDGVNEFFSTTYEFLPESLNIYLNGLHLKEGGNNYVKDNPNRIRLLSQVFPGDKLEATYIKR